MEHGPVRVISKVSPSILQNNHQHAGQETNPLSSSTVICGVSGTDDSLSAWFKRASDVTEPDTVYFSLLCPLHSLNASLEKKNRRKASHCNASCFLKKEINFCLSSECTPSVQDDLPLSDVNDKRGCWKFFHHHHPAAQRTLKNPKLVSSEFMFKLVSAHPTISQNRKPYVTALPTANC